MDRDKRPLSPKLLAGILAAHVVITSLTWHSISRRPADRVRGSKQMWRLLSGLNTLGTVGYFVVGRKR